MALIKCKECGKEVSDKATKCVHCGAPIEIEVNKTCPDCGKQYTGDKCLNCGYVANKANNNDSNKSSNGFGSVILAIFFVLGMAGFFYYIYHPTLFEDIKYTKYVREAISHSKQVSEGKVYDITSATIYDLENDVIVAISFRVDVGIDNPLYITKGGNYSTKKKKFLTNSEMGIIEESKEWQRAEGEKVSKDVLIKVADNLN